MEKGYIRLECKRTDGTTVTLSMPDDMCMKSLYDHLQYFCLAISFHPELVKEYFEGHPED